ncbi:MAG: FAD-dependent oxidoreductase [Dehalococcoidales bacterium]|nr:FAD-dependent oxidoreductase [Dehalococcoidales bacterium]
MNATSFKKLFEPFRIGRMTLKNRIVLPPMGTNYAAEDGQVSQRLIDYYEARAQGGAGLIIVEGTAPDTQCHSPHQPSLGDDRYLDGWRKLADTIHRHGAKAAVQLHHSSRETWNGEPVQVGPSPVTVPARIMGVYGKIPHELTTGEIRERVQWFATASVRAKQAGFDGVEIHGAHQYLIASFLSSATNQRQDEYGGSVENKARFLIEIIQAIKQAVGPDYPVWTRINGQEYGVENGVTIEETRQVVPLTVKAGAQAVHVSAYAAGSYVTKAPIADTEGFLVPLAEEVKKVTSVPVIAVGRLDLEIGERILEEGKADLIAIGRRLMADPALPRKAAEGSMDEIDPCIGCMECIDRPRPRGQGVSCTINAAMGREREYRIEPAKKVKTVVVVGGGPAGIEAARVAALRGHRVTLFEKESRLGGLLNIAALPPYKGDIIPWVSYQVRQVQQAGADIRLNTAATPGLVAEIRPDAVIVATGATPIIPDIPGVDGTNVVTAQDVLSGKASAAQDVVIIGGGMVGCETGHYLAEKGKTVTIIEILPRIAADVPPMVRRRLIDGLRGKRVTMLTGANTQAITGDGVTFTTGEGKRETIKADTVIVAVGSQSNNDLLTEITGKVPEVHCIGDSSQPRRIVDAVSEGYRTGLLL